MPLQNVAAINAPSALKQAPSSCPAPFSSLTSTSVHSGPLRRSIGKGGRVGRGTGGIREFGGVMGCEDGRDGGNFESLNQVGTAVRNESLRRSIKV